MCMRSSSGGWVLDRLRIRFPLGFSGFAMYIGAIDLSATFRSAVEFYIFSKADASPSGNLVSLAAEASARYSRFSDTAK